VFSRSARRIVLFAVATCGAACAGSTPTDGGSDATGDTRLTWTCPVGWVQAAQGGCGPAVDLCARPNAASGGACDTVDFRRPLDADGGSAFRLLPDGAIGGRWPSAEFRPDAGSGAPPESFAPDAGPATCAPGWTRAADRSCLPTLRTDCGPNSGPLPDGTCTRTGARDCPASGEYPDPGAEAIGATIVHVRAGADAMIADGSIARPFASISAAVRSAGADGWVLVAAGEYRETLVFTTRVHVLGRCASETVIRGIPTLGGISLRDPAADLDLRDVTIRTDNIGLSVARAAHVRMRRVWFDGNRQSGITVIETGSTVDFEDGGIVDTRTDVDMSGGYGILVGLRATIVARRIFVSGSHAAGLDANGTMTLGQIEDSVLRDTRTPDRIDDGPGLFAHTNGTIRATRSVIEQSDGVGALAALGRLELTDCIVRTSRAHPPADIVAGIQVQEGGTALVTGTSVRDNAGLGIVVDGASRLTLSQSLVLDNRSSPSRDLANGGLRVQEVSTATLFATRISGSAPFGIVATGAGTRVDGTDVAVEDTRSDDGGLGGTGVVAQNGATITLRRARVSHNQDTGVSAIGAGARMTVTVAVVADNDARRSRGAGMGAVQHGAIDATGVRIVRNAPSGLAASGAGSSVQVDDSIVEAQRGQTDGRGGYGLVAIAGGTLRAHATVVDDNRDVGAVANGAGSILTLDRCVVRRTARRDDGGGGWGIGVEAGGRMEATASRVESNAGLGIFARDTDSVVEMRDTVISGDGIAGVPVSDRGVAIENASSVLLERVAVIGVHGIGVSLVGRGLQAAMHDVSIADITPADVGGYAIGIGMQGGVTAELRGVYVARIREVGIVGFLDEQVTLDDVIVHGVQPSARGGGIGIAAWGGTTLTARRTSVIDATGVAIAAVPGEYEGVPGSPFRGSSAILEDVFVRSVHSGTIRVRYEGTQLVPDGRAVAYGLHTSEGCTLRATRALLVDGGYGVAVTGGTMTLDTAVITAQLDAAGATRGGRLDRTNVFASTNSTDIFQSLQDLPSASSIPPPTPIR